MKHICQLTNLIADIQLLKPFIEPILMSVGLLSSDFLGIFNDLPFPAFSNLAMISIWTKNFLVIEKILSNIDGQLSGVFRTQSDIQDKVFCEDV